MISPDQKYSSQIRSRRKAGSLAKIITDRCRQAEINEIELRSGSQRSAVSELRITLAEIARHVGVGTTAVAMAIKG